MDFKRITLNAYHGLTGSCELAPGRVNVLRMGNGQGKSTLPDAIFAALYAPRNETPGAGSVLLDLNDSKSSREESLAELKRRVPDGVFRFCYLGQEIAGSELLSFLDAEAESRNAEVPEALQRAIAALKDPTATLPEISATPLSLSTALEQLKRRLAEAESELRALESARERGIADGLAAERLEEEARVFADQHARFVREALTAELREIRDTLSRAGGGEETSRSRMERMEALRTAGAADPGRRAQVDQVVAQWRDAAAACEAAQRAARPAAHGEDAVELSPERVQELSEGLDKLRDLRLELLTCRGDAEEAARRLETVEAALPETKEGPDRELLEKLESLPESASTELLELASELREAETALYAAQTEAAETRALIEASRSRRDRTGALSATSLAVTVVGLVASVVLLATRLPIPAAATGAVACALGGAGLQLSGRGRREASAELESSLAREITLSSALKRLHERTETLSEETYHQARRAGLQPDDVARLPELQDTFTALRPRRIAEQELAGFRQTMEELASQAAALMAALGHSASLGDGEGDILERISAFLASGEKELAESRLRLESVEALEQTRALAEEQRAQLEEASRRLAEVLREEFQRAGVEPTAGIAEGAPLSETGLSEAVEVLGQAFARGAELQGLEEEQRAAETGQSEERAQALRERVRVLEAELGEVALPSAADSASGALRRQAADAQRRAEDLRLRAQEALTRGAHAMAAWRAGYRELRHRLERLQELRAAVIRSQSSAALALEELNAAQEQSMTGWRAELAERVGMRMERLDRDLRDYYWSGQLTSPPSAFSQLAGRRLEPEETSRLGEGWKSQVWLALRLSLAERLAGRAGKLPLILDEPFASWDDLRFVEGMRWLIQMAAAGYQIILLTGHRWRLAELDRSEFEIARELHMVRFE